MRAIRIHKFGGIDTMRLDEIPRPVPRGGRGASPDRRQGVTVRSAQNDGRTYYHAARSTEKECLQASYDSLVSVELVRAIP